MTRPTVLDMDLVVVPREATELMVSEGGSSTDGIRYAGCSMARSVFDGMLSASPYPTAWDDVRKYVEGLERERDEATETLRYCEKQWSDERGVMIDKFVYERNRAEAAERQLSEIAGHMDSECDSDSILHVVREAEADRDIYKDRAESAEARIAKLEATIKARENGLRVQVENHKHALRRIAELEKRLADAERVNSIVPDGRLDQLIGTGDPTSSEVHDMAVEILNRRRAARAYMEGK